MNAMQTPCLCSGTFELPLKVWPRSVGPEDFRIWECRTIFPAVTSTANRHAKGHDIAASYDHEKVMLHRRRV